jgi:hypothetical protein
LEWGERLPWRDAVAAWSSHIAGQVSALTLKRYAVSDGQFDPFLFRYSVDAIDGKMLGSLI